MEVVSIIKHIGLTFAIGGSTFAMVFYYAAMWDGKISEDESHFMHIVYFILRIGMCILIPWEVLMMVYQYTVGNEEYFMNVVNWFRVILLGIIVLNATLMTKHKMPMWFGPALAGGSWYYYYFVSLTQKDASLFFLFGWYVVFVAFLLIALRILKRKFIEHKPLF